MPNTFVQDLATGHLGLSPAEITNFRRAGIRSADDLHGLIYLWTPQLGTGTRALEILKAVEPLLSGRYRQRVLTRLVRPMRGYGAGLPPGPVLAPAQLATPPDTTTAPTGAGALAGEPPINLRLKSWPVRDQGTRGTCIAFAAAACCEAKRYEAGQPTPSLSPQFLYWATKTQTADPHPTDPTTWLCFAKQALSHCGIPTEAECPYDANQTSPVAGPAPSQAVINEAATNTFPTSSDFYRPTGAATRLLNCLQVGRPAAISLPTFTVPNMGEMTNWTTQAGWSHGTIYTPLAGWTQAGGHAVCVTGFVPDATEPVGGFFIVRNSWGSEFAEEGNDLANAQGYGAVGATYVEECCGEILQIL